MATSDESEAPVLFIIIFIFLKKWVNAETSPPSLKKRLKVRYWQNSLDHKTLPKKTKQNKKTIQIDSLHKIFSSSDPNQLLTTLHSFRNPLWCVCGLSAGLGECPVPLPQPPEPLQSLYKGVPLLQAEATWKPIKSPCSLANIRWSTHKGQRRENKKWELFPQGVGFFPPINPMVWRDAVACTHTKSHASLFVKQRQST